MSKRKRSDLSILSNSNSDSESTILTDGVFCLHGRSSKFWLHGQCPNLDQTQELILDQGGKIVKSVKQADFALFPNNYQFLDMIETARMGGAGPIISCWVEEIIARYQKHNKYPRTEPFKLNFSNYLDNEIKSEPRVKRVRVDFSPSEQKEIVTELASYPDILNAAGYNDLWQELADRSDHRHDQKAYRDHYQKKKLIYDVESQKLRDKAKLPAKIESEAIRYNSDGEEMDGEDTEEELEELEELDPKTPAKKSARAVSKERSESIEPEPTPPPRESFSEMADQFSASPKKSGLKKRVSMTGSLLPRSKN